MALLLGNLWQKGEIAHVVEGRFFPVLFTVQSCRISVAHVLCLH